MTNQSDPIGQRTQHCQLSSFVSPLSVLFHYCGNPNFKLLQIIIAIEYNID